MKSFDKPKGPSAFVHCPLPLLEQSEETIEDLSISITTTSIGNNCTSGSYLSADGDVREENRRLKMDVSRLHDQLSELHLDMDHILRLHSSSSSNSYNTSKTGSPLRSNNNSHQNNGLYLKPSYSSISPVSLQSPSPISSSHSIHSYKNLNNGEYTEDLDRDELIKKNDVEWSRKLRLVQANCTSLEERLKVAQAELDSIRLQLTSEDANNNTSEIDNNNNNLNNENNNNEGLIVEMGDQIISLTSELRESADRESKANQEVDRLRLQLDAYEALIGCSSHSSTALDGGRRTSDGSVDEQVSSAGMNLASELESASSSSADKERIKQLEEDNRSLLLYLKDIISRLMECDDDDVLKKVLGK